MNCAPPAPTYGPAATAAATAARGRQDTLTKPQGSLGRLEEIAAWLARWQGRAMPKLDKVQVVVFAGIAWRHRAGRVRPSGRSDRTRWWRISPPAARRSTNSPRQAGAALAGHRWRLERPTGDFTQGAAMDEADFLKAVSAGYEAVDEQTPISPASARWASATRRRRRRFAAALFGGEPTKWVGRGTGVDDAGLKRKAAAIEKGLARHKAALGDPLRVAAALGGRELAAIMRRDARRATRKDSVLLDGFVCTAAAAPLQKLDAGGLAHALAAHVSAESGHRGLLAAPGWRRSSTSACGSAKARAQLLRSTSCAPHLPAIQAWRALLKRVCRRDNSHSPEADPLAVALLNLRVCKSLRCWIWRMDEENNLTGEQDGRISRRCVFFIGGYEPKTPQRLFSSVWRGNKPFRSDVECRDVDGGCLPAFSRRRPGDSRHVVQGGSRQVTTEFHFLGLDLIVTADAARPLPVRVLRYLFAFFDYWLSGTAFSIFAKSWRFGLYFLYPFAVIAFFFLAMLFASSAALRFAGVDVPGLSALIALLALFPLLATLGKRWSVTHLMDLWSFSLNISAGGDRRPTRCWSAMPPSQPKRRMPGNSTRSFSSDTARAAG